MKTLATALVLSLAPAAAFAACDWQKNAAMSCADGTVYDAERQACVPTTG